MALRCIDSLLPGDLDRCRVARVMDIELDEPTLSGREQDSEGSSSRRRAPTPQRASQPPSTGTTTPQT